MLCLLLSPVLDAHADRSFLGVRCKPWKEIIVEKTYHLFGDKFIHFINDPSHSQPGAAAPAPGAMMEEPLDEWKESTN